MSHLNGNSVGSTPSHTLVDRSQVASSTPQPPEILTPAEFGSISGNPMDYSPISQSAMQQSYGKFNEEWDASQRGSSVFDGMIQRSNSGVSAISQAELSTPSRGGTLKKKKSLSRGNSLKRSGSRRSSRAGSVRSLALQPASDADETQSVFYTPVPTSGNPTEILANRFQAWRKVLKDLIAYFKEIQTHYDQRSKSLLKVSNVVNNTTAPTLFLSSGGIDDAVQILRNYHKLAIAEANKSKDIENDVILALVGLRSDLNQKIKEIKSLSGDFKNSVDKEMENTRKAVNSLQEALGQSDVDPAQMTGRQDPYLLRLAVDRQVEKQIDEENYLHQAYLNLEASGTELEAIVVGEIQKSYNAYAGILKREAEGAYAAVEELRTGPIAMPKDQEWKAFVERDEHFVDPRIPVRQAQNVYYPGRDNELTQEVRAGLLERKSKYLKSYTSSWFVLTPSHLHEFKSPDKHHAPVMSLYLPDQKLGSKSSEGSSSNKFMLKGRQTGSMHRGHSWIFRAESYPTMEQWYEDIKALTEKSPQERNAFVRQHARSVSGSSQKAASVSSDGMLDEEDEEPFSATPSAILAQELRQDVLPRRPQPGGRFPSDLQVNAQRGLQAPHSTSSGSSDTGDVQDYDVIAAANALPGSGVENIYSEQSYGRASVEPSHAAMINEYAQSDGVNPYTSQPIENMDVKKLDAFQNSANVSDPVPVPDDYQKYSQGNTENQPRDIYHSHQAETTTQNTLYNPKIDATQLGNQQSEQTNTSQSVPMSPKSQLNPNTSVQHSTQPNNLERPPITTEQSHHSIQSISQLHVPGGFPEQPKE